MMKKWHVLCLLLAVLLLALPGEALADETRYGVVNVRGGVNVRLQPSAKATKVTECAKGTWLTVSDEYNGFYQVRTPNGQYGWVQSSYLTFHENEKALVGTVTHAGFLNLRKSDDQGSSSLGKFSDGTPCQIIERVGDWYYVNVDGHKGYFMAKYLSVKSRVYSNDVGVVIASPDSKVKLRKAPREDAGTVTSIKAGTYCMILQKGSDWWKISVNGYVGYMSDDYLVDGAYREEKVEQLCQKKGNATSTSSPSSSTPSTKPSSSSSNAKLYAVVNNPKPDDKLNLRAKASKDSRSLGKFKNGSVFTVLEKGDQWCKVRSSGGLEGYMMTEYLVIPASNDTSTTATVKHPKHSYVNLRSGNSMEDRVLVRVAHGEQVTVLTYGNTWCKVRYKGYTGYMMTSFLKD